MRRNSIRARSASLRRAFRPCLRAQDRRPDGGAGHQEPTASCDSISPILFMADRRNGRNSKTRLPARMRKRNRRPPGTRSRRCVWHRSMEIFELHAPRERLELVQDDDYWDKARVPMSTRWCCCRCRKPTPHRGAASGSRLDQRPAPDALPEIKAALQAYSKRPHVWPWHSRALRARPERHRRPQGGQSLGRSRGPKDGLLAGLMVPRPAATRSAIPGTPTRPPDKYDKAAAQKLMQEAATPETSISRSRSRPRRRIRPDCCRADERIPAAGAANAISMSSSTSSNGIRCHHWRRGAKDPARTAHATT